MIKILHSVSADEAARVLNSLKAETSASRALGILRELPKHTPEVLPDLDVPMDLDAPMTAAGDAPRLSDMEFQNPAAYPSGSVPIPREQTGLADLYLTPSS